MRKQNHNRIHFVVEQIKNRIDIREIAEEHLNLNRQGMACCPFHSEKTPSFSVSSKKKRFKCFGCGIGGDVIDLYAKLNNLSNGQAIGYLGQRLGLSSNKPIPKSIERKYAEKTKDKKLEQRFLQAYKQVFYNLCSVRDVMNDLARQYEFMEDMELDDLLVQYYHERAYHEHLLEWLLAGILEEISFKQQIDVFLE